MMSKDIVPEINQLLWMHTIISVVWNIFNWDIVNWFAWFGKCKSKIVIHEIGVNWGEEFWVSGDCNVPFAAFLLCVWCCTCLWCQWYKECDITKESIFDGIVTLTLSLYVCILLLCPFCLITTLWSNNYYQSMIILSLFLQANGNYYKSALETSLTKWW